MAGQDDPGYSVRPNPDVPFEVCLHEADFLVVNKPAGVVTEPGKKHRHDSLLNGLFAQFGNLLQNLGAVRQWGLLHRLDRDTSGLVVVALRARAYDHLRRQFEERQVKKIYWAVVAGVPNPSQGVIQKPIREVAAGRKKAVLARGGKPAITAYRVLESAGSVSLVEARPKTGRLHQIRVHFAEMGCPVLGDAEYGTEVPAPKAARLCLHAAAISFIHPAEPRRVTVRAPMPKDLTGVCKRFGLTPPTGG